MRVPHIGRFRLCFINKTYSVPSDAAACIASLLAVCAARGELREDLEAQSELTETTRITRARSAPCD